jgi:hypothetical protein
MQSLQAFSDWILHNLSNFMLKKLIIAGLSLLLVNVILFASVYITFAAVTIPDAYRPTNLPTYNPTEPSNATTDAIRNEMTFRFLNILYSIAGTVAIIFIVTNSWFLIAAAGSEEQVGERKKGLMWALIGLVLIILSYTIIRFVIQMPFQTVGG